ncbi:MAG: peptide deformylase [Candidatus Pacebacteria bacterium]|nr:peptide deformylase [Candidatus Paceibacterota bacterium]
MLEIIQKENPVLRMNAKEVPLSEIGSPKIKKVLRDMKKMLATQPDGVAIAAPQIGVSLRIFVVSGKIFSEHWKRGEGLPKEIEQEYPDVAFINPVIQKVSKTKKWMHEGCLSVRPLWGEVQRSTHATVTAYDETGNKFTRGAGGLLAHIFQHETDHLNGVLFIDNARNVAPGQLPEIAKIKKVKKVAVRKKA